VLEILECYTEKPIRDKKSNDGLLNT